MNLKNQKDAVLARERLIQAMYQVLASHPKVKEKQQFAKALLTHLSAVVRWEQGSGFPTVINYIMAYKVFGIDLYWVLLGQQSGALSGDVMSRLSALEETVKRLEQGIKKRIKK